MQQSWPVLLGLGLIFAGVGFVAGLLLFRATSARLVDRARGEANEVLESAHRDAELARKAAALEAREEGLREKERFEADTRSVRRQLEERTLALDEAERAHRRESEALSRGVTELERERREVKGVRQKLELRENELRRIAGEQIVRLERIAGLTVAEARRELEKNIADEVRAEAARLGQRLREDATRDAERAARRLILLASQRIAAEQSIESTVTVVPLPSDEMKGRIIGREGRNIRSFEMATGIDVIIDDTPEAVLLSGYEPLRREIARVALERLIADGRIHPARIEEVVARVTEEVEQEVRETGEKAALEVAVHGLGPEVTRQLGLLRFRTSSGQNVLKHSIEVAHLAEMIGAELGMDRDLLRRIGLLHDIGKALDQHHEGPHALAGMEFLRKHGEGDELCEAVGAHHGELSTDSVYAVLVSAADAISGARPGARRESLETYVRRLRKLEEIAESFDGVERSYAIQAGREVRILVQHQSVGDEGAGGLAADIARRIEKDLQYPGQIKVVVIREFRVVDYAR